jgi:hypothetical protein
MFDAENHDDKRKSMGNERGKVSDGNHMFCFLLPSLDWARAGSI